MAARSDSVFDAGDPDFEYNVPRRKRAAKGWQIALQASTIVGILVLIALLLNILDGAFGYDVQSASGRSLMHNGFTGCKVLRFQATRQCMNFFSIEDAQEVGLS